LLGEKRVELAKELLAEGISNVKCKNIISNQDMKIGNKSNSLFSFFFFLNLNY
jgi:hypothetical protein